MQKQVLDVACGAKMFYFDKEHPQVLFCDNRQGDYSWKNRQILIEPDTVADFRSLPFEDESFNLVIFDPPHLIQVGEKSWTFKKYGKLEDTWQNDLAKGFKECWRVLKQGGTLVFKWSEVQIKLSEVLKLFNQKPLLGNKRPKQAGTHWLVFYKE